ncbi:unnamed protein product [Phytomonas sp. EM1]|nr:unnamed protein product [Phytomonas sp. EM1]|eukprot:CCW61342.1 unnamed protein product [Phytomonas sp. isolate EM1]
MTDPFTFLIENLHKHVKVCTVNGDVIDGELICVDDFNNILIQHWQCAQPDDASNTIRNNNRDEILKHSDGIHIGTVSGSFSIRFVRGEQIKHIALNVT